MTKAPTPIEIFCSYAHADEPWLRKLETHLSVLTLPRFRRVSRGLR